MVFNDGRFLFAEEGTSEAEFIELVAEAIKRGKLKTVKVPNDPCHAFLPGWRGRDIKEVPENDRIYETGIFAKQAFNWCEELNKSPLERFKGLSSVDPNHQWHMHDWPHEFFQMRNEIDPQEALDLMTIKAWSGEDFIRIIFGKERSESERAQKFLKLLEAETMSGEINILDHEIHRDIKYAHFKPIELIEWVETDKIQVWLIDIQIILLTWVEELFEEKKKDAQKPRDSAPPLTERRKKANLAKNTDNGRPKFDPGGKIENLIRTLKDKNISKKDIHNKPALVNGVIRIKGVKSKTDLPFSEIRNLEDKEYTNKFGFSRASIKRIVLKIFKTSNS